MNPVHWKTIPILLMITVTTGIGAPGDIDNDGLRDEVENQTGVFVSRLATGTQPNNPDSDGDSIPDGIEVGRGTNPTDPSSKIKRPNIIYIVADDMGYGDVGCFWQNQKAGPMKFATPGLDAMAAQGAMLTHHYVSASICAPSRCSFLQGRSQGHATIRDIQFDSPLPLGYNVAGMLKSAGYRTIHIGKAGLAGRDTGAQLTAHPLDRGFDRFFGYLLHGHAHEHYPRNGLGKNGAMICNDRTFITDAYQDLFSADAFTAFAKKSIVDSTSQNPDKPFFIYLAYDTPHFDNQYPPTASYPSGGGLQGGLQWTGSPSYVNTAINDPNRVNNPANRHPSVPSNWGVDSKPFVSMIRRMDDSVADILQTLRDLGIDKNTLVVFTTDNGPEPIGIYPPNFESYGPFEGTKADLLEGGIRVPAIVWWPDNIPATNQLSNIRKVNRPCANYDWLSTFADLALCPPPAFADGTSLAPTLTGQGTQQEKGFLYFELNSFGTTANYKEFPNHKNRPRSNMQAVRLGNFMGLRTSITSAEDPFMIFDVVNDPKQAVNLASTKPDMQREMKRLALGARRPISTSGRPYDSARIPAFQLSTPVRSGIKWKSYEGYWPWLPDFRTLTPSAEGENLGVTTAVRSRDTDVGLLFEGYLSIATAGTYTFQMSASSEASLWLHESLVIDNDYGYTAVKTSGNVPLEAGLHPFRLLFRHRSGTPTLDLRYSGPGITMRSIPTSAFFQNGQPTILAPDSATVARGEQGLIDVLSNDTAEVPLVLTSPGTPLFGSSAISAGKVSYLPNAGFMGIDRFSYEVTDSVAASRQEVTITSLADGEIWFPLDEGQGSTTRQAGGSGTGLGTLVGPSDPMISWVKGKDGRAIRFRGIDDIVQLQGLNLPQGSAPRTFSCWMRTASSIPQENQAIFSYGGNGFGQRFTLRLAPSPSSPMVQNLRLETGGGVYSGTTRINDGYWHQISVTVADRNSDGLITIDETRFFVDGRPDVGRLDAPGVVMTGTGIQPSIGGSNHAANYNFTGEIDDVRIFDKEIQPATVSFLATTLPVTPTSGTNVVVSQSDFDGDGFSNEAESTAGTDPEDPGAYPRITGVTRSGSGVRLTWMGIAGRTYWIEESSNLKTWGPAAATPPVVVDMTEPDTSTTIPGNGVANRFFRLRVEETTPALMSNAFLPPMDQDKDGASDEAEFIAGTDPFNASSVFSMKMARASSGALQVNWSGVAGRTYRVEESNDLKHWRPVPGVSPVVVTQNLQDIGRSLPHDGSSQRFLRISVSLSN